MNSIINGLKWVLGPRKKEIAAMKPKKGYTIKWKEISSNFTRRRGPVGGFTRTQAIAFMAKCLQKQFLIRGALFDNKIVTKPHLRALKETAQLWNQLSELEAHVKSRAAQRARRTVNMKNLKSRNA